MTKLFNVVFKIRYLAALAIIFPFFGAALMLLYGALSTVNAYLIFFGLTESDGAVGQGEEAVIQLVAALDHFLFATILMVFALGLYALFFRTSWHGKTETTHEKHLSWNKTKNLGGMDEMLLKVMIMLLSLAFLEFMLNAGLGNLSWSALVVPLTIIALAFGLKLIKSESGDIDEEKDKAELQGIKLDDLERLATLHKEGIVTDAEFEHIKKELLHD